MRKEKKTLIIVESPAKARTVKTFLDVNYEIKASVGHVRDLPKSELGINILDNFKADYIIDPQKKKTIKEISEAAKQATDVYLATDPDREGEAISWHLMEAAKLNKVAHNLKRIVFHEITKQAIEESLKNPRNINMSLVNAQQARRILDRIVGYKISPILWSKIQRGLSAGRVQSIALRLIVDRETEIDNFKPKEYWNISVLLATSGKQFVAHLHMLPGSKKKAVIANKSTAEKVVSALQNSSYVVNSVSTKTVSQKPRPPFITSTMQQEAARRFRFTAKRTMRIAQQLYEGIKLDDGQTTGLITYMRTDSTSVSRDSIKETMEFIKAEYGKEYAHPKPRLYKTKSPNAQEAHEAIRPVRINNTPTKLNNQLSDEQWKLYNLIWKRMVASQMANALLDSTVAEISANCEPNNEVYLLRVQGSVVKFDGFQRIYSPVSDAEENGQEVQISLLPKLSPKQPLQLSKADDVKAEQKFTQPPPRYSEATLIKTLEKEGVGRPSTYASIVDTIEVRNYVTREKNRFIPTPLGKVVCTFLIENFSNIMDIKFTSEMEEKLDTVASGKIDFVPMLQEFNTPFESIVTKALEAPRVKRKTLEVESDEKCKECESAMVIRYSRNGRFLGCSQFPTCKHTRPIEPKNEQEQEKDTKDTVELPSQVKCEKCGSDMVARNGPLGKFLGCSSFPKCRNIVSNTSSVQQVTTNVKCPKCKKGNFTLKASKRGVFYGCNAYPKCKFTIPRAPLETPCSVCGSLLIESTKVSIATCINKECKWEGELSKVETTT